ncbi:glycerol kinase [Vibrio sp. DW001]|uniref:glycerol kinase n=1 Tax=Vibrio sp. DW001 TaxID=2912315 RepID=UPI0023AE8F1D|nr:glycerol kinase [Vibrio sp. DW001]WED29836.1 glycerol kinase [Vibrio sp. DW001]
MQDKISTTNLAKQNNVESKALFSEFNQYGYIVRHENKWLLTDLGKRFGGEYVTHAEYGQFIVWPKDVVIDKNLSAGARLTATQVGDKVGLHAKKINQILNELGWIDKTASGWVLSELGLRAGGEQREDKNTSALYTLWHDTILKNRNFKNSIREFSGADSDSLSTDKSFSSFKQKFEAKHRTSDGHYVRSKGELIIDNWLYMAGLVHAYERKLPIEEEFTSNFYLPNGKVYIQFWGSDTGPIDAITKQKKRLAYTDHGFNLIEIESDEIDKLDQLLPHALRKLGIKAH